MSSTARDQEEQDWRIEQMVRNIELVRAEGEKLRANIREISEQSAFNRKGEVWKIVVPVMIAAAALLGTGVVIGRFIAFRP